MVAQRSLAERFWSLASVGGPSQSTEPAVIVSEVLVILDALERGGEGGAVDDDVAQLLAQLRSKELDSYAAPERVGDEFLDTRSLVFSVGVLIFERLTGQHPFGADASRRVARMRRGEFGSGVNYFPQVPPALRTLLMRAMGPFPEERYQSLAELRRSLEAFLDAERRGENAGPTRRAGPGCRAETVEPEPVDLDADEPIEDAPESSPSRPTVEPAARQPEKTRPARRPARSRQLAGRASWLVAGIAIGAAAVYLLGPSRSDPGNAAGKPVVTAARPTEAPSGPAAASPAAPTAKAREHAGDPDLPDPPEPAPRDSPASSEPPDKSATVGAQDSRSTSEPADKKATVGAQDSRSTSDKSAPVPAGFDPDSTGRRAAQLGRACLSEARIGRGMLVGVSVRYDRDRVGALYFAHPSALSWPEKKCFRRAVLGMDLGTGPDKTTLVQYRVSFRRDGQDVVAKLIP